MPADLKAQVAERDGSGCFLCSHGDGVHAFRLHPDKGDALENLVGLCNRCRDFYSSGETHRISEMSAPRWAELIRRQRTQGYKRFQKAAPRRPWRR